MPPAGRQIMTECGELFCRGRRLARSEYCPLRGWDASGGVAVGNQYRNGGTAAAGVPAADAGSLQYIPLPRHTPVPRPVVPFCLSGTSGVYVGMVVAAVMVAVVGGGGCEGRLVALEIRNAFI